MIVNGKHYRTVWMEDKTVFMIDQNALPFKFQIVAFTNYLDVCTAIRNMTTRGAGAIGAAAGFAMALAARQAPNEEFLVRAKQEIASTRPTAYNLFYSLEKVYQKSKISTEEAIYEAQRLSQENADQGEKIGEFGATLIRDGMHIETHCNAGWLGFVDWGSALSPVYKAKRQGKSVHVWVDETRPRNQGARLTAWELYQEQISHTIVPDNAGAFLMAQNKVEMIIVGADRIAANGDTANKIGTLEKAIVARYYNIPFYVAAPSSTFDKNTPNGKHIIIEERNSEEVTHITGQDPKGNNQTLLISSPGSPAFNPSFDITPATLISGFITDRGIIPATSEAIKKLLE